MSDVNIDHIEALVGPLPRRREWERWCEYTQPLSLPERGKADAAIAELEATVEALKCCVCGKPLGDEAIVVGWNPWNGTQAVHPECEPDYEEDHL